MKDKNYTLWLLEQSLTANFFEALNLLFNRDLMNSLLNSKDPVQVAVYGKLTRLKIILDTIYDMKYEVIIINQLENKNRKLSRGVKDE